MCLSLASRAHGFNLYVTRPGACGPLQASLLAELKQKLHPSGDAHSFLSFHALPAVVFPPGGSLSSHTLQRLGPLGVDRLPPPLPGQGLSDYKQLPGPQAGLMNLGEGCGRGLGGMGGGPLLRELPPTPL